MHTRPISVKAVFDRALEMESLVERRAYLDEACAAAPELRQKVEGLLRAYEEAGSFLESPAAGVPAALGGERQGVRVAPRRARVVYTPKKNPLSLRQGEGAGGEGR